MLPARFPNLLVNGGGGIAVGMATNIPPHNIGEVIDATLHVLDNPDATNDDLMQFVLGPDFPTGGIILGRSGIHDAYRTGRGSIKMRAVAEIEETKNGQRIVVSETAYQTSVEVIGQKIAELVNERKIEGIRDVRNESSGDTVRLVVELKRDANAQVVLNQLYKHTPMQTSFPVHMLALVDGAPRLLDLSTAIKVYVLHQMEVVQRRTEYRLRKAKDREHIVEGLVKALDMIDAIIALIRGAADVETARAGLMAKPFEFSEVQANYILDMQLRRLTQLEGQKLREELAELQATIKELESILASKTKLRAVIKDELGEVRKQYGDGRRTPITVDTGDLDTLDLIEDEEVVVVLSHTGYVKTVAADAFRTQGRGGRGVRGGNLRDEDYVEHLLTTTAHSYLLFFSNRGRVYRLRAHEIPMKERTARGTAIVNLISIGPDERIEAVIDTRTYEDGAYLFFATRKGQVKKTRMGEYDSSLRSGPHRDQPQRRRRAGAGDPDQRRRRHPHGVEERHEHPLLGVRRAPDGPGHRRRAGDEAEERRRRGGGGRRRPRRRGDAVRELERPREAHEARAIPPSAAGRSGRTGYEDHRFQGRSGGRVHSCAG